MAKEAQSLRPWFLDLVPLLVVLLIAAHLLTNSPKEERHTKLRYIGNLRNFRRFLMLDLILCRVGEVLDFCLCAYLLELDYLCCYNGGVSGVTVLFSCSLIFQNQSSPKTSKFFRIKCNIALVAFNNLETPCL
ncbi:hypothetical protein CRYUN_Cryun26dG0004700 [Craigia yunnanensis]